MGPEAEIPYIRSDSGIYRRGRGGLSSGGSEGAVADMRWVFKRSRRIRSKSRRMPDERRLYQTSRLTLRLRRTRLIKQALVSPNGLVALFEQTDLASGGGHRRDERWSPLVLLNP